MSDSTTNSESDATTLNPKTIKIDSLRNVGRFRSVLMLEDEDELADLIKDYLEENLFRVTRVPSGAEGIKQVMHSEIDIILCDVLMPTFPGDMFYKAVERIKPDLCQSFIFMTGHRGNPKVDRFLRQVKALTLYKPFLLGDLMDNIRLVLKKDSKARRN